jgi:tetratricopeptide (TPR) repeat protein
MKELFFIITLLFFNITFSQINFSEINGKWIKYKVEMKDGSKLFDRFLEDSTYLEYNIYKNKLCINSNPIHKTNESCLDYTLINNFIKTSQYSGFIIEKASNDSLVLIEKIDGLTDDRLKRFYFVNQEVVLSKFKEENKNRENIIASKLFTPKTNSTIELDLNKAFKNNYSNFELVGNFKIYPNQKKVKTQITFSTQKDSSRIRIVKKVIDDSFEKWNLTNFNDFESIEIPFVLKSEITKRYWGITVVFITENLNELQIIYGGKAEDNRKASEYFSKGISAYQEKKYLKAIEYFTESYRIDPKNIDALYNKGAVYFESGDKENACNVWKEISEMGQVNAKELYLNNCN